MEEMKRFKVPAFGDWNLCDEIPITQYFESAVHAHYFPLEEERDLFQVPVQFIPAYYNYNSHTTTTKKGVRKGGGVEKQRKVCDVIAETPKRIRAPKAVDEDLYKIPPELLYQKPKRKRIGRSFWSGCLGISCMP
ncbi:hypothetical protein J5N97_007315 [Dioscorea zingiberensis]|uniref:Uncharacterized protein n=1 Tax=Dioscorea zingiberensis TaxID=325984 RepID=A0A9D5DCY8_9LILI|nr:hypothetical protein J5N97_007315 [Dioscorea zingiberensis]